MKSSKALLLFLVIVLMSNCGGGSGGGSGASSGGGTPSPPSSPSQGNNVLSITVNGSLCSPETSYFNKPCVSVTICTPGTSSCQTINDILLDTGDFSLRIFKQALTVSLPQVPGNAGLAECIQYADGSSVWGPIQMAIVSLGNEPAVQVPIQVIDSTFGKLPAGCQGAYQSPSDAGFNGALGVGLFAQDCGSACSNYSDNGMYYICAGSNCTGTTVSLSNQVQNPVALLPQDNNGVLVQLPSLSPGGAPSVNGYLVLGIGTQSNNVPSTTVKAYAPDLNTSDLTYGDIVTIFNGISYGGFIDTGSNGLYFPSPSSSLLPDCPLPNSDFYCPSSLRSFSATNTGASGSPSGVLSFEIGNADSLFNSNNNVFVELGGVGVGEFDWGLPFLFGRNVYIGIEGRGSSLGSGPYWAY